MRTQAGGRNEDEASTGRGEDTGGGATTSDDRGWWCEPGGEDRGLPVRIGGYR